MRDSVGEVRGHTPYDWTPYLLCVLGKKKNKKKYNGYLIFGSAYVLIFSFLHPAIQIADVSVLAG